MPIHKDPPSPCDVLVLGEYFCDLIFTGLPELPRLGAELFSQGFTMAPGGSGYILTAALGRLGVQARWMAQFGSDLFSQFVLHEAQREGLDSSLFKIYDQPLRSLSASFSFIHDRGFISYWDPFPVRDLEQVIAEQVPRWVVNTLFDSSSACRQRIEFIHQHKGQVFVDCQYITTTLDEPGLVDTLRVVDVFAPNQSEACQLTGEDNPQKAAARLAEYCHFVVVKAGAQGAYAQCGKQTWHAPALPVEVVDTTGAGDAFNAGFLAGMLKGEPIETCLRYGTICGGLSTTQRGGASAAPTWDVLCKHLHTHGGTNGA
jgi:sugar/nucleoside kinase (ribokinase family)